MQRVAASPLGDLLAATEAVGDDQPVWRSFADGRQQFQFADSCRGLVFVVLETEGAGHPAASRSRSLEVDADALKQRLLGSHLHDRFMVAVPMQQRLAFEARQGRVRGMQLEEFAEQKRLP